jgi:hypothetical protein
MGGKMISLDLNLVRAKDTERAALAAQVAQYLAGGGPVEESPTIVGKPLPSLKFVDSPAQVLERNNRRVKAQAEDIALAEQIRSLAETMTIREVGDTLTMPRDSLRGIARRHDIQFKTASRSEAIKGAYASVEQDAREAACLRRYAELGTSLHHAATHSGIGKTRAARLAKDYCITFPHRGKA